MSTKNRFTLDSALDDAIVQANERSDMEREKAEQDEYLRSLKLADRKIKKEKLSYIAQILTELRQLSLEVDEGMIAYLIEMAVLEVHAVQAQNDFSGELGKDAQ
ncbi:MAG: hypothetical protein AB8B49_02995 [Nitratireductor sp.]